jgi:hypothetical protein
MCSRESADNDDDDDIGSSGDESSQKSHSIGGRAALQTSTSAKKQELSKEWMFEGTVAMAPFNELVNGQIPQDQMRAYIRQFCLPKCADGLQLTFSQQAPVKIEHIVIFSDILKFGWNPETVLVDVRGYVAASKLATRQMWDESIQWYDEHDVQSLTWTRVTGGIRSWPQYIRDMSDSTLNILAEWGSRRYFDARGYAWMFTGKLILPPRTAENDDILQMATEAFNEVAGPPDARPDGLTFLAVQCNFSGLQHVDPEKRVRFPCRGFLQANDSKSYKWEKWLPEPWCWRPVRGGLGGDKAFEEAEIEVKSANSGWIELFVDGKLGRNNSRKMEDALQARHRACRRTTHYFSCNSDPHRGRRITRLTVFSF